MRLRLSVVEGRRPVSTLDKLVFRLQEGNVQNRTVARLAQVIRNAIGKQLPCGKLTQ